MAVARTHNKSIAAIGAGRRGIQPLFGVRVEGLQQSYHQQQLGG
jgi:hypothetical protein